MHSFQRNIWTGLQDLFFIGILILIIIIETTGLLAPDTASPGPVKSVVSQTVQITPQKTPAPSPVATAIPDKSKDNSTAPPATNIPAAAIQKPATPVPAVSPVTVSKYVQYNQPLPDPDDAEYTQIKPASIPVKTLAPVDYLEIFHANQTFTGNSKAISFMLKNPPMIISYTAIPQEITDLKYTLNRDAEKKTSDGKLVNVTRWDENSWFEIMVFDKARNGTIIAQDGFGKGYDQDLSKEIVIRNSGTYQIKFEGNFMSADISAKVLGSGNT